MMIESPAHSDTATRSLRDALTLDRQRAGTLESMGACTSAEAREAVEIMLEMAIDHAHYIGPFHVDV